MSEVDEDAMPQPGVLLEDGDPTDETQDFRFLTGIA